MRMPCRLLPIVAVLLLLGNGVHAAGPTACANSLTGLGTIHMLGTRSIGYDPFAQGQSLQIVTFSVTLRDANCPYFVTFSAGQSRNPNHRTMSRAGATLTYQLFTDSSLAHLLKDYGQAAPDEVLVGAGNAHQGNNNMQFIAVIAAGQIVAPGSYSDDFEVTLYEGTPISAIQRDVRRVSIQTNVPAEAQFSFGTGGSFGIDGISTLLDFGLLKQGAAGDVLVLARANGGYSITLSSAHGGVLTNTGDASQSVPYGLTVDGAAANLAGKKATEIARWAGATTIDGLPVRLHFTIGTPGQAAEGTYRDVLTITIQTAQ